MRILLAEAGLGPLADWVGAFAVSYASRFADRGHDVLLLVRGGSVPGEHPPVPFRVWRCPETGPERVRIASFALWAAVAVARWRPDAVLAFAPFPEGAFFQALSRVLTCRYATMVNSAGTPPDASVRKLARGLAAVFDRSQFVTVLDWLLRLDRQSVKTAS